MLKVSNNPVIDTATKLVAVAILMFAFVFVVMVPLYNVLCDVLGLNGKTSAQAYTAVEVQVDTSREVTIQFVATNNDGMPWEFGPSVTAMKVNPGATNDTVFLARNPLPEAMVALAGVLLHRHSYQEARTLAEEARRLHHHAVEV